MGNTKSAAVTISSIYDLQPSYVVMFGIAGGVGDDVGLCDVIIPNQIFYCAYGKEITSENLEYSEFQMRPRSADIDQTLLNHIHDFRMNHSFLDNGYSIHTGVFAITEKVVASKVAIEKLKGFHRNIIGIEMESYGVALAAQSMKQDVGFIAVRGVSDHADHAKNDDFRTLALKNAADFLCCFLREENLVIVPKQEKAHSPEIIAIRHLSRNYRGSVLDSLDYLGDDFASKEIIELVIDQTDLFDNGSLMDPSEAIRRQTEMIDYIVELQKEFPKAQIKYFGLAHVPLVFQLGFALNRQTIEVFGNEHNRGNWFKLYSTKSAPKVVIEHRLNETENPSNDVIVMMSVSHWIHMHQLEGLPENPKSYIHIYRQDEIGYPDETASYAKSSVEEFIRAFQQVRNHILRNFPTIKYIHLFYAGAPTVAFRCAQLVNPNIDPGWIIYNFARHEIPPYGWAIHLQTKQVIERR